MVKLEDRRCDCEGERESGGVRVWLPGRMRLSAGRVGAGFPGVLLLVLLVLVLLLVIEGEVMETLL